MNTIAYLLIFIVTCCHLSGQLILKRGINSLSASGDANGIISFLLNILQSPHVWIALFFQGLGYVLWFFVLRIADWYFPDYSRCVMFDCEFEYICLMWEEIDSGFKNCT